MAIRWQCAIKIPMIAMGTMNSENIYEVPATSNTGSKIELGDDVGKE